MLVGAITRRHHDEVLAVLRSVDDATLSPARRAERLVRGMIAIHSVNPALHRVLLEGAPGSKDLQSAHDAFEVEYLRRYEALLASAAGRRKRLSDQIAAQVLSSAVAGAIHDAAQRGTLASPAMQQALLELVCAYLLGGKRAQRSASPSAPS